MKRLLLLSLALVFVVSIQSCDVIKQSVSTTSELYIGKKNDQPVKFEDKFGYINHLIDMKATGFWAEYIKGVTFMPVKDFDFEINEANSLTAPEEYKETEDGKKLVWFPLYDDDGTLLIRPYTRELH